MKKVITILSLLIGLMPWGTAQNGLNFDGGNDVVQTSYPGVIGSADRTFEAWVYVPSSAPSTNLAILDYGVNAAGDRNTFYVSGNKQLGFISGGTNANISTGANAVPINQWAHVAFVLNNGTGYLYVNGVQQGTGSLTSVSTPSNQTVRIGQRVSGGTIPFHGTIDEVRIWDVARTVTQIQTSMNSEFCAQDPNLKLYFKFNEGVAAGSNSNIVTATDDSGNGYNGTLSNFSLTGTTSNWVSGTSLATGGGFSVLQQTACNSFSLTPTSTVYTTSGTYTEVIPGINGCDSIISLNLTITNSTSSTDVQSACGSYTWIDGNTYTTNNNNATFTLTNAAGCDSVVTLDLTLNNNTGVDVQTGCGSYTWIDGNTYTVDNDSATFTLTNAAGCDSVITLNLTIDTVNVAVIQDGISLIADQIGLTYQWVECPSFTPISGATSQTYTATVNGDYAVIITDNQCSDTSACYSITTVGTFDNEFGNSLTLFPNPTDGQFSIDMGETYKSVTVTISDMTGKVISSTIHSNSQLFNLDVKKPAGIYLVMIETATKRAVVRLVKK